MISDKLALLKDFILLHNPYFNQGFDDVILDDSTGYVFNDQPVFPADNLGNYFYLRLPNNVTFDYDTIYKTSECASEPGIKSAVILVACMRDADRDKLFLNLLSTILAFKVARIKFISGSYQPDAIVSQELAKIDKSNIEAALQRLPEDYTLISITFSLGVNIFPLALNCIQNPCNEC